jgi:hypothetical protein
MLHADILERASGAVGAALGSDTLAVPPRKRNTAAHREKRGPPGLVRVLVHEKILINVVNVTAGVTRTLENLITSAA